ncbi:MAG: hypothetical protein ACTTJS_01735 [Wolinella sp.]
MKLLALIYLFGASLFACQSDFECGIGLQCVKKPFETVGICMQSVNRYGIQQYKMPSLDSIGPNMNINGDCSFDTDCPIGFQCNKQLKVCIKG